MKLIVNNGKVKSESGESEIFESRLVKIRESLEKINRLVSELKKIGEKDENTK